MPFTTINGSALGYYTTANGIMASTSVSNANFSTTVAAGKDVTLSGSTTVSSNIAVNSLVLSGDVVLTIAAGVTLTVTSGAVLVTGTTAGATIVGGGTLALGEGIVIVSGGVTSGSLLTIGDPMTGTNITIASSGGTLAGSGTVALNGASTYSGSTTLASGNLILGVANALPAASTVALIGGSVQTSISGGVTIGNAVTFNNSVVGFAGSNPIAFSGTVTLTGNALLSVNNTGGTAFAGQVAGAGALSVLSADTAGADTLFLTNAFGAASSFTGQTTIVSGIISGSSRPTRSAPAPPWWSPAPAPPCRCRAPRVSRWPGRWSSTAPAWAATKRLENVHGNKYCEATGPPSPSTRPRPSAWIPTCWRTTPVS